MGEFLLAAVEAALTLSVLLSTHLRWEEVSVGTALHHLPGWMVLLMGPTKHAGAQIPTKAEQKQKN